MILNNLVLQYGGIYLANLNPSRKTAPTEVSKTRPVLVMQSTALLEVEHPSTIILPLTTQLKNNTALRFRIPAQDRLEQNSDVLLDQIRAIDNQRFQSLDPLCVLELSIMSKIFKALLELLKP